MSRAWWQALVIPATQEAEAGESLEPSRRRMQLAEIMPLHSSLGDRVRLHLKNKQTSKHHQQQQQKTFVILCLSKYTVYYGTCIPIAVPYSQISIFFF